MTLSDLIFFPLIAWLASFLVGYVMLSLYAFIRKTV